MVEKSYTAGVSRQTVGFVTHRGVLHSGVLGELGSIERELAGYRLEPWNQPVDRALGVNLKPLVHLLHRCDGQPSG